MSGITHVPKDILNRKPSSFKVSNGPSRRLTSETSDLKSFKNISSTNPLGSNVDTRGLNSVDRPKRSNRYFLGVMAIFHSEEKYLKEWIDFHLKMGIDRFYLYNNDPDSQRLYQDLLEPYYQKDQIVLHDWPDNPKSGIKSGPQGLGVRSQGSGVGSEGSRALSLGARGAGVWTQRLAYQHCLQNYGHETTWMAVLDIDEFLFPDADYSPMSTVTEILASYSGNPNLGQLLVPRLNFGNYWHTEPPLLGGVPENYLMRANDMENGKPIIRTSWLDSNCLTKTVYQFNSCLLKGAQTLNGRDLPFPLKINHYMTKSSEEFHERNLLWLRKHQSTKFNPPDLRRFKKDFQPETLNVVYDDSILHFYRNNKSA